MAAVSNVPPVDDRIGAMLDSLQRNKAKADKIFPGLAELLQRYLEKPRHPDSEDISTTEFLRGLARVFRYSKDAKIKNAYDEVLDALSNGEQKRLEKFVKGSRSDEAGRRFAVGASPEARKAMKDMEGAREMKEIDIKDVLNGKGDHEETILDWIKEKVDKLRGKEHSKAFKYAPFQNWGRTVENIPLYTFVPKKVKEVKQIVKFAKSRGFSVRCAGYRHSWAPVFGTKGQVLISMLDLDRVENLPDPTALGFYDLFEDDDEPLEEIVFTDNGFNTENKRLVRVGTATTNETFRRWCNLNEVSLPLDVIMVEITLGGSNAPICHGAGRQNKNLSDLIRRIDYVDAHGEKRYIDDPKQLKAAAGCFGLLGVVTHLTFEVNKMTVAKMQPVKIPAAFAIPPPPDYINRIPQALVAPWMALTEQEKKEKQREFERRAASDFYAEWFWFPLADYVWVNTWNEAKSEADIKAAKPYPSDWTVFEQFVETVVLNILQNIDVIEKLVELLDLEQPVTTLISRLAMHQLPGDETILCPLPDALHFQRAIQNVRVRDMEIEIPLQPKDTNPKEPDFALVQHAWWDAILHVYEEKNLKTCPMRMPLEMRIMGGSEMIMASQRGNELGTCAIEVLTLVSENEHWHTFSQEVLDTWMSYKQVKTRPHWAKEWYPYTVNGKPWIEKLKNEDFKDDIAEFKDTLSEIGKDQNWTLTDLKQRFSNDFFDQLIFFDVD